MQSSLCCLVLLVMDYTKTRSQRPVYITIEQAFTKAAFWCYRYHKLDGTSYSYLLSLLTLEKQLPRQPKPM